MRENQQHWHMPMNTNASDFPNTPMMQQYLQIKQQYPSYILFYRMGDFFEMFADDALAAADVLQITLTRRRSAKEGDEGVPMCGVPFHAAEGYIAKLIEAGFKVALCEQTESPEAAKKRDGHKALVRREVTRLYTGGTLTEDNLLPAQESRRLAAIVLQDEKGALAHLDLSTGTCGVQTITAGNLSGVLAALNPAEILVATAITATQPYNPTIDPTFFQADGEDYTTAFSQPVPWENTAQQAAMNALLGYVHYTQRGQLPALQNPTLQTLHDHLLMDAQTRQNLEIVTTRKGQRKGSLLGVIDNTVTAAGARLLQSWLSHPLTNIAAIEQRQQAIQAFKDAVDARQQLRNLLRHNADPARAIGRVCLGRGSPRDVHHIRLTLAKLPQIEQTVQTLSPAALQQAAAKLRGFDSLCQTLDAALAMEDLPQLARDGGFIRAGFDAQLDTYRDLQSNGLLRLQALEQKEKEATGISTLKLKYNKVWGYFFEVSQNQAAKIPENFIHRQTTSQTQRFSTADLMTLERDVGAAGANALSREQQIFQTLVETITQHSLSLLDMAEALATLDVYAANAELAHNQQYIRPTIVAHAAFEVTHARHPVVEQLVDTFIPNDCHLGSNQLWILTGPNMAGKSTYLRQNALMIILAQAGLFVPADAAEIGLTDRIFTRIGAADDLAEGQSTFMVEMLETAQILTEATARSFVVLDEMGRGTATYDGMSLAWACIEHMVMHIGCRTLFATHYHELTALAIMFDAVDVYHVAAEEWQNDIIFLHTVKPGAAPRSYGIQVARHAGVPDTVIQRATDILHGLEQTASGGQTAKAGDLPLFTAPPTNTYAAVATPADTRLSKLDAVDVDALTPREALQLLYELKAKT